MFDTYNQLVSESVVTYLGWVQKNLWPKVNIHEFLVTKKKANLWKKETSTY